ncbi:MAG TPA: polyphosphate kinase 2 family protein [Vicinamibacterales bacterium]|nr:polyphosphate kinase 2 family protein [Vicinamibacterales bacterium]
MKRTRKLLERTIVRPGRKISLEDYKTDWTLDLPKEEAAEALVAGVEKLAAQQDILYAADTYAILLIFQAMDAAGKDGTIKHVMSGINPQGCQVYSFKAPSTEERQHGYLWRSVKALPERGRIGIHNRSYYEEVLVVRIHPELLEAEQLPDEYRTKDVWHDRYRQINQFERYLVETGTVPIKFFLHVSKEEQKRRFLERIDHPDKNWKFSAGDVTERALWDRYMDAYEDVFSNTSTKHAPWYIIPADNKWFMRLAVADIIHHRIKQLKLRYPSITSAHKRELLKARKLLLEERR